MRGALGLLLVGALTVVGLIALSDATKYRGETADSGETQLVIRVRTKGYPHDVDAAATSLWGACVGTVKYRDATPPQPTADGDYVASLRPALGADSGRRFRGCLEDATVDKVLGDVVDMSTRGVSP